MENNTRRKVIVVDDISFGLTMTKNRLKDYYEIYPAYSGERMFELLEKITPDIILLDINMPEDDGFAVLEKLKKDTRYADIPVIFLTAVNNEDSVIKGATLGAAGHVAKPFSVPELRKLIENTLNPGSRHDFLPEEDDGTDKPSVLAVDDSPAMLKSIHYALRDMYKVYTLPKPEHVVDFLQKVKPDLFLLDYKMPVLSGFDLIPLIREFPEHQETPIVFLTTEGTVDHLTAALHLGASDFIVKPFSTRALRKKIEMHIEGKKEKEKDANSIAPDCY